MKTLKQLTALALVIVICAGCLAACGTSPDAPTQEPESQGPQMQLPTEPATQEQTTPPTPPAEKTQTVWVLAKEITYRAEGTINSFIEYNHDERGFLTGGTQYSANGELIRDLDYYTYTIEDNVITRELVSITDGTVSAAVYQFTFDDEGILRRICLDNTGLNIRLRDWYLHYDENGRLASADQYQDYMFNHLDTPATRKFEVDENNRLKNQGRTRITLDENGRPIEYMIIDTETGKCDQLFYFGYKYKAIQVPETYAAMAQGLANFFEPMLD